MLIVSGFFAHVKTNYLTTLEGHAVGALGHGGVCLVSANLDLAKGAVVYLLSVMLTLLDTTFDILVFHGENSFLFACSFLGTVYFFLLSEQYSWFLYIFLNFLFAWQSQPLKDLEYADGYTT